MKRHRTASVSLLAALAAASVVTFRTPEALAQRRIVEDTSPVKTQQRAPRTITRGPSAVATARQATNSGISDIALTALRAIPAAGTPAQTLNVSLPVVCVVPGGAASTVFYVYSVHLKSGTGGAEATQRGTEGAFLRSDIDSLGEGAQVISLHPPARDHG